MLLSQQSWLVLLLSECIQQCPSANLWPLVTTFWLNFLNGVLWYFPLRSDFETSSLSRQRPKCQRSSTCPTSANTSAWTLRLLGLFNIKKMSQIPEQVVSQSMISNTSCSGSSGIFFKILPGNNIIICVGDVCNWWRLIFHKILHNSVIWGIQSPRVHTRMLRSCFLL